MTSYNILTLFCQDLSLVFPVEWWDGTLDVKSSRGTSADSSGIRPHSSHQSLPSSL